MHTSTFGLKFGSLSPAVTLKIRSWSPKPNQLFIMSHCYIHANLIKIRQPVHEISCKQESVTPTPTPTLMPTPTGSAPKTICPPSPSVGDIHMHSPHVVQKNETVIYGMPNVALFDILYIFILSLHCYCIFLYLYSISVHFYCIYI